MTITFVFRDSIFLTKLVSLTNSSAYDLLYIPGPDCPAKPLSTAILGLDRISLRRKSQKQVGSATYG